MGIELLGPLRVDGDGGSLQRRDQVVLSALAVRAGEALSADQLAEASWGDNPPKSWQRQIPSSVLRLRRRLGAAAIETTPSGYRLTVAGEELDTHRFEELIARGRTLVVDGESDRAAVAFGRALELWRGAPFDVLDGWSPGRIEAARLDELRLSAEESLLDARLASGEHRDVVAVAEARVAESPLREHRWAILATALYRCGRQADALRALKHARHTLVEQLGIEPGAELVALEHAILRQDEVLLAVPPAPSMSGHCPYKGLAPYDVDDSEAFFGRDGEVTKCVDRLRTHPLLVVTGPSGCGKSSLVRAGLVHALARAGQTSVVFVPGADPEAAMSHALASSTGNPVLVVDQFEELFTLDEHGTGAGGFCARLAEYAVTRAPVVAVVRADHVAELAADESFAHLAEHGIHLVPALTGDALRAAIEGPAALAGLRLEHGLVDLLVRDCEGEPGALPLLSHALSETWQRRDGRVLTVEGYRATGEIRGAVARSADRLYESLPADQRPKLRSMLLRLVSPSPDGEPVRSRVATRSLGGDADRDRVLGLLVRARLVTAEEDSVELAHEALARAWPRLRSWLDEDAAGQRTLRHLSTAADGWESLGRPATELYRGARLEAALEWRTANAPDLTLGEQAFLDASAAEAETEQQQIVARARRQVRQNRRLRRSLLGVAVLLVAALVGGVLAYQQRQSAQREERQASLTALTSTSAAVRTTRRDLAALLAIEADRMSPSAATQSALLGTFTAAQGLERVVHTDIEIGENLTSGGFVPGTESVALIDTYGAVHVVDLATGADTTLEALNDGFGWPHAAVSGDGRYVAALWRPDNLSDEADWYSLLTVWDLQTGRRRFEAVRVPFAAASLAINEDGSMVAASGGYDGDTHVYDGATGALRVELDPLPRPDDFENLSYTITNVFHPDGTLVVGSMAGPVRIVDPSDGAVLRTLDGPPLNAYWFMALSRDGSTLITTANSTVMGFDLDSGEALWAEPRELPPFCNNFAYADRLGLLLCGQYGGTVVAFDVDTGKQMGRRYNSHGGDVCGLFVSDDGTRMAAVSSCVSGDATIVTWRLDGGGPVSRLVVDSRDERYVGRYGFGGDGANVLVEFAAEGDEGPVSHVLDPSSGEVVDRFPGQAGFLPTDDPNVVVTIDEDGTIGRYDVAQQTAVGPRVAPGFDINGFETDGRRVVMTGWDDVGFHLRTYDLDSGRAVEPSIDSLFSDGYDYFEFHDLAITPDFLYTTSVTRSNRVQRRDGRSGEVLAESPDGFRAFTIAGGVLVANTTNGRIEQLDPITLQPIGLPFPGVTGPVDVLILDENAQHLIVLDGDITTLHLYDVPTRTLVGDIDLENPFPFTGAALRGDGMELVVNTGQGTVVWDLDPAHWAAAACQVAGRNLTHAEWDQYIGDLAPYRQTCPGYASA